MKVLQINKYFRYPNGTSRYFLEISKLLSTKNHHVISYLGLQDFKFFTKSIFQRKDKLNTDKDHWLFSFYKDFFYFFINAKRDIINLLSSNIDIVHTHSIYHQLPTSIFPEIKKRNIPIVMTIHDYNLVSPNYLLYHDSNVCEITKPTRFYRALFHKCVKNSYLASAIKIIDKYVALFNKYELKNIDYFITPSNFMKKKLAEFKFPMEKIITIPHFVTSRNITYNSGKYLLYFGRLYEEKGLYFLIEVMRNLKDIDCIIVGDGPLKNNLQELIHKEKIKNVFISGFKTDRQLHEIIHNSRLVILPSLWYEGFGLSIIEAFNYYKPVLGSKIGAIPEVIDDGETGLLFEPGNVDDCRKKILTLWNNPDLIKKMGYNAKKKVEKKYSSENHYNRIMDVYEMAISK